MYNYMGNYTIYCFNMFNICRHKYTLNILAYAYKENISKVYRQKDIYNSGRGCLRLLRTYKRYL